MGQQGQGYETNDDSGVLFKNDRRESENHPHAKGKALIGGVWYWVSAWTKEGRSGRFQSLSFQEMTPEQANRAANRGGGGGQRRGNSGGTGYGSGQGSGGGSRQPPPQRQQPQQRQQPGRQRQADPPPFGDEQAFQDADIPF